MTTSVWVILVAICLRAAGEGFEKLPLGEFEKLKLEGGVLVARKGDAVIHGGHAKACKQSLRLLWGEKREVKFVF